MDEKSFSDDTFDRIRAALLDIDENLLKDIYVISFYKGNHEDDPRHPMLTVGYNTVSRWTECTPKEGQKAGWPKASDSEEAKWNFAFWLQNEELVIGGRDYDPVSDWVKKSPHNYTDDEEEDDYDRVLLLAEEIQRKFIDIMISHARKLHESGLIVAKFGKQIPVIIHELEYYDVPLNWTKRANPQGLVGEFENWINAMY